MSCVLYSTTRENIVQSGKWYTSRFLIEKKQITIFHGESSDRDSGHKKQRITRLKIRKDW